MRATMTLISIVTLSSSAALAQWEVRPAPASWGVPQYTAPAARQPTASRDIQAWVQTPAPPSSPTATSTDLSNALTCSAALQLATMAAPNWAQEKGITNITNAWLQKVFALGEPQGIAGDKVPGLVEAEMHRQTESASSDPASLSRRAFDCASRQP
jgi:hypothetical protein